MNTGLPLSDIGNLSSALGNSLSWTSTVGGERKNANYSLLESRLRCAEECAGLTALGCSHLDARLTDNH